MTVIALVKFNQSVAIVLDEMPPLVWNKVGNDLFGTNGTFCDCLFYERSGPGWEAFGGRKFDVILESGEVVNCYGQYWSGIHSTHRQVADGELIHVTAKDIDGLKKCYVFCGYTGIKDKIEKLVAEYSGAVYDYWDYEVLITKNRYKRTKERLKSVKKKYKWDNYLTRLLNSNQ